MDTSIGYILALAGRVRASSGYLHMLDLLQGLSDRGVTVSLLCVALPDGIGARNMSFPVHTWREMRGRRPSWGAALGEIVQWKKTRLIHVHGAKLGRPGRSLLKAVDSPIVFTPHSAVGGRREIGRLQRRCARVIALNETLREGLMNSCKVPRGKISLVAPGLEIKSYVAAEPASEDRVPVVGMAAPLVRNRGHDVFLSAAKRLLDSGRRIKFLVVGDGPAEHTLRREIHQFKLDKHIILVTRLSGYRDVIGGMDIFVRPSPAAGIGYIVLEAMAMGKAVVVASTKGVMYLVEDGRTGLVVAKGDAGALAEAIGKLLADPRGTREMGHAARRRVGEQFNMDRLVDDTLRVYAQALESEKTKGAGA